MPDQNSISSGELDRVVVLQRRVTPSTKNDLGEPIEVWVDLATVWAGKMETGGGEAVRAAEEAGKTAATFKIRYTAFSPPLNPRDRLLFNPDDTQPAADGLAFNIRRIAEIGRRVGHMIYAETRADQLSGPA